MYNGKITREELEDSLTGALYARYKRQIDDIYAKRLTDEAKKFRKKMIDGNVPLIVIWIYGQSGLGRRDLPKKLRPTKVTHGLSAVQVVTYFKTTTENIR